MKQPNNTRQEELLREQVALRKTLAEATAAANKLRGIETTPTAETPPPLPKIPKAPGAEKEVGLEKTLDDARAKYAEEYKKLLAGAGRLTRAYRFVVGAKIDDSKIPPELKKLETEYERATVEYGQKMYDAKKAELESSKLSDDEKKAELARFKQNDIFTRVIVEEQAKLNALKVENLPPKEKGVMRKSLDWYLKQPRWKKLIISTALGTAVIATVSGGTVAAAGGITYYAGLRITRTAVGAVMGQLANVAFDRLVKEKSTTKRATAEKELAEMFKEETFDLSLAKSKKEYAEILEREQKAKRNRLITKAVISLAAGIGTSIGMGYLSHHFPDHPGTSGIKPAVPTTPDHTPGPTATPATVTPSAPTPVAPTIHENIINQDAIVHKGEGIEHAFRRQIEHNGELAKSLGFKGGDAKALHEFSGRVAHELAKNEGYVNSDGQEIRVMGADKAFYEIKIENGQPIINEGEVGGAVREIHHAGQAFEQDTEKYEYKGFGRHEAIRHDVPHAPATETHPNIIPEPEHPPVLERTPVIPENAPTDVPHTEIIKPQAGGENYIYGPRPSHINENFYGSGGERPAGTNYVYGARYQNVNENFYGARGVEHGHYFPGLSQGENAFLNNHLDFVGKNPYNLTGRKLIEAYNASQQDINHFWGHDLWENFKDHKASTAIKHTSLTDSGTATGKLGDYLTMLKKFAGPDFEPKSGSFFHWKAETVAEFQARALQKIEATGQLEAFEYAVGT